MSRQKSSKSDILYYHERNDEIPRGGWAKFAVMIKQQGANLQQKPDYIAAGSKGDAKKIIAEDYQTHGHGYL
jgi:hypothetical protein